MSLVDTPILLDWISEDGEGRCWRSEAKCARPASIQGVREFTKIREISNESGRLLAGIYMYIQIMAGFTLLTLIVHSNVSVGSTVYNTRLTATDNVDSCPTSGA